MKPNELLNPDADLNSDENQAKSFGTSLVMSPTLKLYTDQC